MPSECLATNIDTAAPDLTWESMLAIEPVGLTNVESYAKGFCRCCRRSEDRSRYYEAVKRMLSKYVGWQARNERLRTSDAWEVAIKHLLSCLEGREGKA